MLGRGPIASTPIGGSQAVFIALVQPSGGYERVAFDLPTGKRKSKEERIEERRRLGILPKAVAKVVERVATEQAPKTDDSRLDAALHRALERERLAFRAYYAEVLRRTIEAKREGELVRLREEEEMAVLLLII